MGSFQGGICRWENSVGRDSRPISKNPARWKWLQKIIGRHMWTQSILSIQENTLFFLIFSYPFLRLQISKIEKILSSKIPPKKQKTPSQMFSLILENQYKFWTVNLERENPRHFWRWNLRLLIFLNTCWKKSWTSPYDGGETPGIWERISTRILLMAIFPVPPPPPCTGRGFPEAHLSGRDIMKAETSWCIFSRILEKFI